MYRAWLIRRPHLYRVSPQKKRNGGFSVPCELKKNYISTSFRYSIFRKREWYQITKIIKFGWVILILCPFLEIQSFSNFAWFLRLMVFCGSPLVRVSFVATDQRAPPKHLMEAFPDTILRSSVAKIKRNLKMTVFQEVGIDSKLLNQI